MGATRPPYLAGEGTCCGKMPLQDRFILVQKLLKSMHFFTRCISVNFLEPRCVHLQLTPPHAAGHSPHAAPHCSVRVIPQSMPSLSFLKTPFVPGVRISPGPLIFLPVTLGHQFVSLDKGQKS